MLEQILSRVRRIVKDARQKLSVESAAAVEKFYRDMVALNDYIVKELQAVERNLKFDEKSKKAARRGVLEQAARKLEVLKSRSNYADLIEAPAVKAKEIPVKEEITLLQFFREKEVRDRLVGMSEAQIISLFGESLFDGSNPLLVNAILNAPEGFEPLSRETIRKIRQTDAGKIGEQMAGHIEKAPGLEFTVGDVFHLVKQELDNLRRKELPESLRSPKESGGRPFKF